MFEVAGSEPKFLTELRQARNTGGKSYLAQLAEIAGLVLGPGHLSPWDYHVYRLWDDSLSWSQKREFIGNNSHGWIMHHVSAPQSGGEMRDKVAAAKISADNAIASPKLQAVYHPTRELADTPVLRNPSELGDFVRTRAAYPFFFKPVTAHVSTGAGLAVSFAPEADQLVLLGGETLGVDDFVRQVSDYCASEKRKLLVPEAGFMLQEVVVQHQEISERCGPTIATLRVCVGIDDRGPHIFSSPWKIPAPGNAADNFYRSGNLLADVDPESGEVGRVIRGIGARLEVFDHNPYTDRRLSGWRLPHFDQLRATVLRGAALFPDVRLQGWDVGIGPDGPVVIEANFGTTFRLSQHASGRGLGTSSFREYVRRATLQNAGRSRAWPISWSRPESIWRLKGLQHLVQSLTKR